LAPVPQKALSTGQQQAVSLLKLFRICVKIHM